MHNGNPDRSLPADQPYKCSRNSASKLDHLKNRDSSRDAAWGLHELTCVTYLGEGLALRVHSSSDVLWVPTMCQALF